MINLNVIWFFLIGLLLTGYAILDGFDLGIGVLYLFVQSPKDKKTFLHAIAPVWDGNEVWLVAGGGGLLAAFPNAYATAFSGFYLAYILILIALIFRSLAIEFRNKESWPVWHKIWDSVFIIGSAGSTVLFGIIIGNIITGLPINFQMDFQDSSLLRLFHPYPILVGFFLLSVFTLHGALYLNLKTQERLQHLMTQWAKRCLVIFTGLYLIVSLFSLRFEFPHNHMIQNQKWMGVIVFITLLAIIYLFYILEKNPIKLALRAFMCSAILIGSIFLLFGIGLFPILLPSTLNPAWSIDIYNAAASQKTLWVMLIIALIGLPFVLTYTISVYWIFRGKIDEPSQQAY